MIVGNNQFPLVADPTHQVIQSHIRRLNQEIDQLKQDACPQQALLGQLQEQEKQRHDLEKASSASSTKCKGQIRSEIRTVMHYVSTADTYFDYVLKEKYFLRKHEDWSHWTLASITNWNKGFESQLKEMVALAKKSNAALRASVNELLETL